MSCFSICTTSSARRWSLGVLVRETTTLYKAISKGKPYPLTQLPLQYGDYAAWQRSRLQGDAIERQLSFWRARLANAPPTTALPFDRPRPPERSFRGAQSGVTLDRPLVARLRLLCQREQATLFMVLIAALATLFHRYSGATDIVIGSPVANCGLAEIEPLIGVFHEHRCISPRSLGRSPIHRVSRPRPRRSDGGLQQPGRGVRERRHRARCTA